MFLKVENLSAEIHRYRHRTMTDIDVQVDKEDLMNYTAGECKQAF